MSCRVVWHWLESDENDPSRGQPLRFGTLFRSQNISDFTNGSTDTDGLSLIVVGKPIHVEAEVRLGSVFVGQRKRCRVFWVGIFVNAVCDKEREIVFVQGICKVRNGMERSIINKCGTCMSNSHLGPTTMDSLHGSRRSGSGSTTAFTSIVSRRLMNGSHLDVGIRQDLSNAISW